MNKLLFDTDVIIDYLRGYEKAKSFLSSNSCNNLFLSSITIAELFAGVRGENEVIAINSLLSSFDIIDVDKEIARQGGLLKQKYNKSNGMGLADALIAASAISIGATLITLNKKHYPEEVKARVPYLK